MKNLMKNIGKKFMAILGKISPTFTAKILFLARTHKWPNLKNPKTFNEKTTWLKLNNYNHNKLATKCADKFSVREYVTGGGMPEILNELYGVYDNFNEIDFSKLPDKFALKCVHGCAYNIIVDNKSEFDIEAARKKVEKWQKEKYGYATAELHYAKIKPRIIIEKYLCDENGNMPLDYKFYCINGRSVGCMVCSDRIAGTHKFHVDFYDNDWKKLPYFKKELSNPNPIEKPKNWKKMIEYAEKLSKGFPFVRVDFYNDDGKIIFGEMTFTPACCCSPKYSKKGDITLGENLHYRANNVQTLLSILNCKNPKKALLDARIEGSYILINQTDEEKDNLDFSHRIISSKTRGLSHSRNLALSDCISDIALFSDDDMEYVPGYTKIIEKAYKKYPDAAAIVFVVEHEDKRFEKRPFFEGRLIFAKSLRISSVQLTVNVNKIRQAGIKFDELFGSGSKFAMGEENIFLSDIYKKHLKVYYVPQKIGTLKVKHESGWFKGYDKDYFIARGAGFYRMSRIFYLLLIIRFAIRKRERYSSNISIYRAIRYMLTGTKLYRKERKNG